MGMWQVVTGTVVTGTGVPVTTVPVTRLYKVANREYNKFGL